MSERVTHLSHFSSPELSQINPDGLDGRIYALFRWRQFGIEKERPLPMDFESTHQTRSDRLWQKQEDVTLLL
jgi:hypothetical protein